MEVDPSGSAHDGFVLGSPTPSVANTVQGDEDEEMDDLATALPSFRFGSRAPSLAPTGLSEGEGTVVGGVAGRKSMKRSNSAPVGLFGKAGEYAEVEDAGVKLGQADLLLPRSEIEGVQDIETKNKAVSPFNSLSTRCD